VRPDGVIRVVGGQVWTALVEVKTGRNELRAARSSPTLTARQEGSMRCDDFQSAGHRSGEHPVTVDGRRMRKVSLHHLSWSQVYTEALTSRGNRSLPT